MKTPKSKLAVTPRTREQWRQWMLHDLAFATERLKQAGQVTQMFVLHKPDGGKVIVRAPFTSDVQRLGVLKFLAAACVAHQVMGFSCITEAWLGIPADQADVEALDRGEAVPIRERETRREVISVMLTYRDDAEQRRTIATLREIVRGADAKPTGVRRLADVSDTDTDGSDPSVAGAIPLILSAGAPSAEMVAAAQDLLHDVGPKLMEVLGIRA